MEWIDQLNRAIGFLEQHLRDKIDYVEAARACCCSLAKFQQIFLLATGVTLSEYVRNRRLSLAAREILDTDIKIADLALSFGYNSPEAFTRAYQAFHGVPPSVTRKAGIYDHFERISFQVQVYGGRASMGGENVLRIETERLIIRKFCAKDWRDVQEMAISKEQSLYAAYDQAWPTDEAGIKAAVAYFAGERQFWAVEEKHSGKVIALINFNDMDGVRNLDIGHVINTRYLGQGFEYEALKALYNFAFIRLGAARIQANWALQDKEKIAPLLQLGMRITETRPSAAFEGEGSNRSGHAVKFESARLTISREEWLTNPAK